MRLYPILNKILQTILPSSLYLKLFIWKKGFEEPELKLVYDLCDSSKISVDVGAANGLYLAHLYPISKECYAFEPREGALNNLKKIAKELGESMSNEELSEMLERASTSGKEISKEDFYNIMTK